MKRTMLFISIFFVVSCGGNSIEQDSSQATPQQMTSAPQNPSMKQEVDKKSAGKNCTLSGGEIVEDGWRGKGTGNNYCNNCFCSDGMLGCTKMACPPADTKLNKPSEKTLNLLTTPFMDNNDYWGVQPFAVQANQLGLQFHNGIDYFTNKKEIALQAISDGRVMFVQVFERPPDGAFQINLAWQTPSGQIISYSLEPSAGPANASKITEQRTLAEKMMQSILIKPGDTVSKGQLIGYLYGQDEWAHVHMTLKKNNRGREEWLCPAEFMTNVEDSNLITRSQDWANRLYKGSKTPKLCNY